MGQPSSQFASLQSNGERVQARFAVLHSNQKSFEETPSEHSHSEDLIRMSSNGLNSRSNIGRRHNNSSMADEKNGNQDWLAAKIASYSVAEIMAVTGMSETAVQNVRRGKGKLNFDNMTSVFKAHPELGAAYMEYIGLLMPGQAEAAAAYTRFANAASAIMQRGSE